MLTFELSGDNNLVYTNLTGSSVDVTVAVVGQAKLEVKDPPRPGPQHRFPPHGGVLTLTVPGGHVIEVDAQSSIVKVEILGAR